MSLRRLIFILSILSNIISRISKPWNLEAIHCLHSSSSTHLFPIFIINYIRIHKYILIVKDLKIQTYAKQKLMSHFSSQLTPSFSIFYLTHRWPFPTNGHQFPSPLHARVHSQTLVDTYTKSYYRYWSVIWCGFFFSPVVFSFKKKKTDVWLMYNTIMFQLYNSDSQILKVIFHL